MQFLSISHQWWCQKPPVQLALSHLGKDGGTGGNLAVVGATPARLVLGGAKDVYHPYSAGYLASSDIYDVKTSTWYTIYVFPKIVVPQMDGL